MKYSEKPPWCRSLIVEMRPRDPGLPKRYFFIFYFSHGCLKHTDHGYIGCPVTLQPAGDIYLARADLVMVHPTGYSGSCSLQDSTPLQPSTGTPHLPVTKQSISHCTHWMVLFSFYNQTSCTFNGSFTLYSFVLQHKS